MMSELQQALHGLPAVNKLFSDAKAEGRTPFLPYFPIGFPTYKESLDIITALSETGVDGFEIGVPFSDPLADGAVIQAATQIALNNGITVRKCLEGVRELRARGVHQPMMMMSYINPLLAYGVDDFARDAKAAGADGLIIPDLPIEEAELFLQACQAHDLALVFFVAPTSKPERIALVAQHARGFIYVVALTGVTGERNQLPTDLTEFIQRLRVQTGDVPLVMGFGISKPEHVRAVSELVDGYIVGSAIVKAAQGGLDAVKNLSASLLNA